MAENIKTQVEDFDEASQPIVTEHDAKEESLGGYNFEMVGSVPKELECIICNYIIKDAVELPCNHVFCKNCLIKWEEQKMNEASKQNDREKKLECCQCKSPYGQGQARESKFVDRMIENSLKAKCKQHSSGCKWTGCISEYFEMHTKYCSFIEITCLFDGCNERFQRKQQETHVEECGYRTLFCEHCGEKQRFIDLENHYASCPSFPMDCPNEECDVKYERNKLNVHLREECMFETMPCPYTHIGCRSSFKRKELETHETQYNNKHSLLMLKQIAKASSELQETKVALETTTVELHDTKATLCDTNKLLDETRAKLENVQNTMAENNRKTKAQFSATTNEFEKLVEEKDDKISATLCETNKILDETKAGLENVQNTMAENNRKRKAEFSATTKEFEKLIKGMDNKITQYKQQVEKSVNECKDEVQQKTEQKMAAFDKKLDKIVRELQTSLENKIDRTCLDRNKDLESKICLLAQIVHDDLSLDIAWELDQIGDNISYTLHFSDQLFEFEFSYEIYMKRILQNMKTGVFYDRPNGNGRYLKVLIPSDIDVYKPFNGIGIFRDVNKKDPLTCGPSYFPTFAIYEGENDYIAFCINDYVFQFCSIVSITENGRMKYRMGAFSQNNIHFSSRIMTPNNELLLLLEN